MITLPIKHPTPLANDLIENPNVTFDSDVIAGVLTKNTYCCNIELSKAVSEAEQRKIVEVVSFNALVNKNLNFNLKLAKSQYLGIELLSNLRIKA